MKLGGYFIDNLDDQHVEKIFLDVDFTNRTVLKIITMNGFEELCISDKVDVLLSEIWEGKETYECDGQLNDFSIINYLATSSV